MSKITLCFEQLKQQDKSALIPFITAGDPEKELTVSLMHELVLAGADMIELGVPFSDPMADGPVIQRASERALANNTSTDDVFAIVQEFRQQDANTPVILMGYLNPIEAIGYKQFAENAQRAGIDGVLVVDLPPEESETFNEIFKMHSIDQIFLVSPTTNKNRLESISEVGSGFLYYVSLKGVTGSNRIDIKAVNEKLNEIKQVTALPVGVGFGIKDADTAVEVAGICDAVVVGSALVEKVADYNGNKEELLAKVNSFVGSLRSAMDKN